MPSLGAKKILTCLFPFLTDLLNFCLPLNTDTISKTGEGKSHRLVNNEFRKENSHKDRFSPISERIMMMMLHDYQSTCIFHWGNRWVPWVYWHLMGWSGVKEVLPLHLCTFLYCYEQCVVALSCGCLLSLLTRPVTAFCPLPYALSTFPTIYVLLMLGVYELLIWYLAGSNTWYHITIQPLKITFIFYFLTYSYWCCHFYLSYCFYFIY